MNKNELAQATKTTRTQLIRAVTTSTAIETGQESRRLEEEMKAKREKFGHLKLAIQFAFKASLTQYFIGSQLRFNPAWIAAMYCVWF